MSVSGALCMVGECWLDCWMHCCIVDRLLDCCVVDELLGLLDAVLHCESVAGDAISKNNCFPMFVKSSKLQKTPPES